MKKGQDGFTLVELIVVIALIGILAAIATLAFMRLHEQYQVDSLTKEIYTGLMLARNNASTTKTPWIAVMTPDPPDDPNRMQIGPDADGDGSIDPPPPPPGTPGALAPGEIRPATADIRLGRFTLQTNTPGNIIRFDQRGLTTNFQTLNINKLLYGATPGCIVIAASRINMGRFLEGGNCVQQ